MVMGSIPEEVDIAVVGGGVGGYIAAIRAAELGKNVAIIEKGKMGGHCLNYACIPSKTLIRISDIVHTANNSSEFGITGNVTVDAKKMYSWRMGVSEKLENGVKFLCKAHGIDIFGAEATFISSSKLQLTDGVEIDFKKAIIATGSEPTALKGFEFSDRILDYKKALMLDFIPKSMTIIGAGYVSVEIGTLYAKLGTDVHIIARSDVLSHFDTEATALVKKSMEALGIKVHKGVNPLSYDDKMVKLSDGTDIESEVIVGAVGLSPYTKGLGLENTKVKINGRGFIEVDQTLRTADENIYAIGDVIGEPMLAHKAMRQGVIAGEAASGQNSGYDNVVIPAVIFSDPEIAIAGVLEGDGISVTKFPMSALGRAIALNSTKGL
ncbi:dihydrolipoamide dehydrogenase [mine drainage metagenome]|uniref:Dihydrolipoamide dehydrogenase n=1 Tax=mine drainage metagenome TaxID=410659 RepID=T1BEH0_9ZZZZ